MATLEHWPLFDLRIRTPSIELRLPTDGDLDALARLAAAGIHDPSTMPFAIPWTDRPSPELERGVYQWNWRRRAELTPAEWSLNFMVIRDGEVVGVQDVGAKDFGRLRQVETGSWLGLPFQGRGTGKEMRAAVLHLAFGHLGAHRALSGAWVDNPASLGVSRALGYVENGRVWMPRREQPSEQVLLLLTREAWEPHRRADIEVSGLEPCLPLLGIG